jgi:hypothetical protein
MTDISAKHGNSDSRNLEDVDEEEDFYDQTI